MNYLSLESKMLNGVSDYEVYEAYKESLREVTREVTKDPQYFYDDMVEYAEKHVEVKWAMVDGKRTRTKLPKTKFQLDILDLYNQDIEDDNVFSEKFDVLCTDENLSEFIDYLMSTKN